MLESNKKICLNGQKVLLVDRETDFLQWAERLLKNELGVEVLQESNSEAAYKTFCLSQPDVVVTELNLQPFNGMELLARIRKHSPNAMVVVTGAFGTTQHVIEAMKLGAFDFVRKEQLPFQLKIVMDSALKAASELRCASKFKPHLTVEQHEDDIVGQSQAMQQVFKMIGRVAASDASVMVTGESGTGKELVARAIHNYSSRSRQLFLAINCAAIPENLLESELFGHEKGAFTGAMAQRIGRFEQCDGGTLFLDEVGEMPLAVQSKLLRVLQEGEFTRVGGTAALRTDVRIVCATNKHLEEEVARKTFREDLFYRLNVVRIHLPPLRSRPEDIQLLAEYFLRRISREKLRPPLSLSEEALQMLKAHSWPGNVRELENTLRRAAVLAAADVLLPKDIPLGDLPAFSPKSVATPPKTLDPTEAAAELLAWAQESGEPLLPWIEKLLSRLALERCGGDVGQAAKWLGVPRSKLRPRPADTD